MIAHGGMVRARVAMSFRRRSLLHHEQMELQIVLRKISRWCNPTRNNVSYSIRQNWATLCSLFVGATGSLWLSGEGAGCGLLPPRLTEPAIPQQSANCHQTCRGKMKLCFIGWMATANYCAARTSYGSPTNRLINY